MSDLLGLYCLFFFFTVAAYMANKVVYKKVCKRLMASPVFVARRDKAKKLCHKALTADFRAGCSSCSMTNSFETNAVGPY